MSAPTVAAEAILGPDVAAAVRAARAAEFAARRSLTPARPRTAPTLDLSPAAAGAQPSRSLRIVYLVPRTDVGGGARVLFEHANRLRAIGHTVVVLSHFEAPDWFDLRAEFRQIAFGAELCEAVPSCDVIVAGYWEQLLAAASLGIAPVVHFEQGDAHLFEELAPEHLETVGRHLAGADYTMTVSSTVAAVLERRYGVDAAVLHNAVDRSVFFPADSVEGREGDPYVLCVGWDGNEFKGMAEMRQVAAALAHRGIETVWVTPRPPVEPFGRVVVSPPQHELADLFRRAAAYVCCSHYESFPLPPMEAMAAGAPVVTTRNVGVMEYARDGENALVAEVGDVTGLLERVLRVVGDPDEAARLRRGGLETADRFSWDAIVGRLSGICTALADAWEARPVDPAWEFDLSGLTFEAADPQTTLALRAGATGAREIAVPVSRPAPCGLRSVAWHVIGRRPTGEGTARVHLPARAELPAADVAYAPALARWQAGQVADAATEMVQMFDRGSEAQRAALGRWLILALLELGDLDQAAALAAAMVATFPGHVDYYFLQALTAQRAGRPFDREAFLTVVDVLGMSSFSDEWFDGCPALARHFLAPGPQGLGAARSVLLRDPAVSPLREGNAPYFVQQLSVSNKLAGVSRLELFSRLLAGKRVLHVGYADWPITDPRQNLHVQLDGVCAVLDGIDPADAAAAEIGRLVKGRLFTKWEEVTDSYDVVLVPEVLEHVADVEGFFAQLDSVDFDTIVMTVPDATQCAPRHFGYDPATEVFTEVVHPDHNAWYSPYTFYNVVTKYTDWDVRGLWFFNRISLLMIATKER